MRPLSIIIIHTWTRICYSWVIEQVNKIIKKEWKRKSEMRKRKKRKKKIKSRAQGFETVPNVPNEQRRVGLPE